MSEDGSMNPEVTIPGVNDTGGRRSSSAEDMARLYVPREANPTSNRKRPKEVDISKLDYAGVRLVLKGDKLSDEQRREVLVKLESIGTNAQQAGLGDVVEDQVGNLLLKAYKSKDEETGRYAEPLSPQMIRNEKSGILAMCRQRLMGDGVAIDSATEMLQWASYQVDRLIAAAEPDTKERNGKRGGIAGFDRATVSDVGLISDVVTCFQWELAQLHAKTALAKYTDEVDITEELNRAGVIETKQLLIAEAKKTRAYKDMDKEFSDRFEGIVLAWQTAGMQGEPTPWDEAMKYVKEYKAQRAVSGWKDGREQVVFDEWAEGVERNLKMALLRALERNNCEEQDPETLKGLDLEQRFIGLGRLDTSKAVVLNELAGYTVDKGLDSGKYKRRIGRPVVAVTRPDTGTDRGDADPGTRPPGWPDDMDWPPKFDAGAVSGSYQLMEQSRIAEKYHPFDMDFLRALELPEHIYIPVPPEYQKFGKGKMFETRYFLRKLFDGKPQEALTEEVIATSLREEAQAKLPDGQKLSDEIAMDLNGRAKEISDRIEDWVEPLCLLRKRYMVGRDGSLSSLGGDPDATPDKAGGYLAPKKEGGLGIIPSEMAAFVERYPKGERALRIMLAADGREFPGISPADRRVIQKINERKIEVVYQERDGDKVDAQGHDVYKSKRVRMGFGELAQVHGRNVGYVEARNALTHYYGVIAQELGCKPAIVELVGALHTMLGGKQEIEALRNLERDFKFGNKFNELKEEPLDVLSRASIDDQVGALETALYAEGTRGLLRVMKKAKGPEIHRAVYGLAKIETKVKKFRAQLTGGTGGEKTILERQKAALDAISDLRPRIPTINDASNERMLIIYRDEFAFKESPAERITQYPSGRSREYTEQKRAKARRLAAPTAKGTYDAFVDSMVGWIPLVGEPLSEVLRGVKAPRRPELPPEEEE